MTERSEDKSSIEIINTKKNIQQLKRKLNNICKTSRFCGICLEPDEKLWAVETDFDIAVGQQTYKKSLINVIDYILNDEGLQILSSPHLCSPCIEKAIQAYLFIFNAKQLAKTIIKCVNEVYSKATEVSGQLQFLNGDYSNSNIVIVLEQDTELCQYTDIGKMNEIIVKETEKPFVNTKFARNEKVQHYFGNGTIREKTQPVIKTAKSVYVESLKQELGAEVIESAQTLAYREVPSVKVEHLQHDSNIHCTEETEKLFVDTKFATNEKVQHYFGNEYKDTLGENTQSNVETAKSVYIEGLKQETGAEITESTQTAYHEVPSVKVEHLQDHSNNPGTEPNGSDEKNQFLSMEIDLGSNKYRDIKPNRTTLDVKTAKSRKINDIPSVTYKCCVCRETLPSYEALKEHIKYIHSKPREPKIGGKGKIKYYNKCHLCDHMVLRQCDLEAHINRFHLKIKPYQCYCKKSFFGRDRLKEHLLTHTTTRTCYCSICNQKFANKSSLKHHMRRHTGYKPYTCEICGEKFITSSIMKTHKIRKHSERTVSCPLCKSMFYLKREMRTHFKSVHWKVIGKKFDPRDVKELAPEYYHLFEDGRLPKVDGERFYISTKCNEIFE